MASNQPALEVRELEFTLEEYRRRLAGAQSLMKAEGLDALFVSHVHTIQYFTGYRSWLAFSQHRPFAAVIPGVGDPIMILPAQAVGNALLRGWVKDIRRWQATDDYVALYVNALSELGAEKGTIGIEMGDDLWLGMPIYQWERFKQMMPGAHFLSSTDLIWELRSVKSEAEIALLREAARITDLSVAEAWTALRPGITEQELAGVIGASMMRNGAESTSFLIVQCGTYIYNAADKYATRHVIEPGEIINLDIGCTYRGYSSDMMRAAVMGTPPEEGVKTYELCRGMHDACFAMIRGGVSVQAVDKARNDYLTRRGLKTPAYAGVGHSIGISAHELPRIGPEGKGLLKAGMVVTIEPAMRYTGWGGFALEDMVLVKENGAEYLTQAPRELYLKKV